MDSVGRLAVTIVLLAAVVCAVTSISPAGAQDRSASGPVPTGLVHTVNAKPPTTQPSGSATGTETQQTDPRVHPRRGTRRSRFTVRFTLRDAPGHHGVVASTYDIQVDRPRRSRAACAAPMPAAVTSGTQGSRISVALPRPRYGWCRGRYTVTIHWQTGPYCPPAQDGQPPPPCPLFASQDLRVGKAAFTVTA